MATTAQVDANRANAQASTGPITPEGKARSARNAATFGLFSATAFCLPGEEETYARFRDEYVATLAPDGPLEHTLAAEITHAAWRLRRCIQIEANLDAWKHRDNPGHEAEDSHRRSVQRARASAERTLHRSTAELRRLQTERFYRDEYLPPDYDQSDLGLASLKDATPLLDRPARKQDALAEVVEALANAPLPGDPEITKRSQSDAAPGRLSAQADGGCAPGRNAQCPCGSGLKYKRCCLQAQWRTAA